MTAGATNSAPTTRRWRMLLAWLAAYAVLVVVVVFAMFQTRRVALETMSTPEAQSDWDAWRESDPNQRTDLPVSRRPPKATEPPALVLMRDHFPVSLTGAVLFSSLLFVAVVVAARGAFGKSGAYGSAADSHEAQ